MADPLSKASLNDLQVRFITIVNVQPKLATNHAKLITHSPGLVKHALGSHRPSGIPNTPNSFMRALKLWYIVPTLLHSQDGRMSRTAMFKPAEHGDLTTILRWIIECTAGTATRPRGLARESMDAAMSERASSTCQHQGGMTVVARGLLAEPRAPRPVMKLHGP